MKEEKTLTLPEIGSVNKQEKKGTVEKIEMPKASLQDCMVLRREAAQEFSSRELRRCSCSGRSVPRRGGVLWE